MRKILVRILLVCLIVGFSFSDEVSISEKAYEYFQEGEKLANSGDYQSAIEKFTEVLILEPQLTQANEWLAFCYIQLGDNEEAISQYKKIVKVNPTTDNLVNLGLAYYNLGYYDDSVLTLRKAVKKSPTHFNALNNLGLALIKNKDVDGAVDVLEKAVDINPGDATAQNNLGMAYSMAGNFELAKEKYFKAFDLDPSLNDIYFNLAVVYKFENNTEEVGNYYLKYLESGGGDSGKVKEAVDWLRTHDRLAEVPKGFE